MEYRPSLTFLSQIISPACSVSEYSKALEAEVKTATLAEACAVFFVDYVRKEVLTVGPSEAFGTPWESGVVGLVARQGAHAHFEATEVVPELRDELLQKLAGSVRSLACLPVRNNLDHGQNIGVIAVMNKLGGPTASFSERDTKVLQDLARLVSDSFYRHRWTVMETCRSRGDSQALSLISQTSTPTASAAPLSPPDPRAGECAARAEMLAGPMRWAEVSSPSSLRWLPHLHTLGFNALDHRPDELSELVELVMTHTGCVETCAVPLETLRNWSLSAKTMYRDNPFHNWYHGFSVFQMVYHQLKVSSISETFSALDVFGLLIAALCHDLDHPGFTNSYMVDSQSELALRHNDNAVLENHHASLACELLRRERTAIGTNLDRAAQTSLRRVLIKCILDTDMAHHSKMCQSLQAGNGREDKQLMLSACIHSADLSGQVLPWKVASQWEERISFEFANQASQETAAGRTPAPFMTFDVHDRKQRGKLQKDFCDFVLLPLWDPYTQLIPALRPCYRNLLNNRSYYEHRWNNDGEDHVSVNSRG